MNVSLYAFRIWSRDGFGSPAPRQPAHLHTQVESGAYLRDSSRVPQRRPFIYCKPPYAIGSVPSLSGHATAYRWRSLPRVRRHRASKPQGSSERVLTWQVTMDQLTYVFLPHTHYYWYGVGMLKVPACTVPWFTNVNYSTRAFPKWFLSFRIWFVSMTEDLPRIILPYDGCMESRYVFTSVIPSWRLSAVIL